MLLNKNQIEFAKKQVIFMDQLGWDLVSSGTQHLLYVKKSGKQYIAIDYIDSQDEELDDLEALMSSGAVEVFVYDNIEDKSFTDIFFFSKGTVTGKCYSSVNAYGGSFKDEIIQYLKHLQSLKKTLNI
jgi:hypothetical protein